MLSNSLSMGTPLLSLPTLRRCDPPLLPAHSSATSLIWIGKSFCIFCETRMASVAPSSLTLSSASTSFRRIHTTIANNKSTTYLIVLRSTTRRVEKPRRDKREPSCRVRSAGGGGRRRPAAAESGESGDWRGEREVEHLSCECERRGEREIELPSTGRRLREERVRVREARGRLKISTLKPRRPDSQSSITSYPVRLGFSKN